MNSTLAPIVSQEIVDVQPGYFELPELRHVTEDGYGAAVSLTDATDDELASASLELLKFRRLALDAVADALVPIAAELRARINARENAA